jgi:hypothetical protein
MLAATRNPRDTGGARAATYHERNPRTWVSSTSGRTKQQKVCPCLTEEKHHLKYRHPLQRNQRNLHPFVVSVWLMRHATQACPIGLFALPYGRENSVHIVQEKSF